MPSQFDEEADRLRPVIGPTLLAIEHVGSTAVPGLAAKPIIDILAGVSSWDGFEQMVEDLGAIGYVYTPHYEKDDPGRRVFRKGPEDLRLLRTTTST
ncbi:MAG TPA: GrpB family protein [Acidimicrobiales bacterium]|nr:GrpB family protein [Acidimicrobiales bacterium]